MLSGVVLKLSYGQYFAWHEGSVCMIWWEKKTGGWFNFSAFSLESAQELVAFFLQKMSAMKLICKYLCEFKSIFFFYYHCLYCKLMILCRQKTSTWAACEQTTRSGLIRLCLSVLCLKGFKYCMSCACVCCQNWTHCHHLHFNFPITTEVCVEAFFFLKWAHFGSRRTVQQNWKQEIEYSGWCECTQV